MSYKLYANKWVAMDHAVALADANGAPVAIWQTVAPEGVCWYRVSADPEFEEPGYELFTLVDPTEAV